MRDTLDVINGKWKLPIIISIGVGNSRYTEIQNSISGITPKVLAKELKELEQHKLIKRNITPDYPDTLQAIIYALEDWGLKHRCKLFSK